MKLLYIERRRIRKQQRKDEMWLNAFVENYFKEMTKEERQTWADKVVKTLSVGGITVEQLNNNLDVFRCHV